VTVQIPNVAIRAVAPRLRPFLYDVISRRGTITLADVRRAVKEARRVGVLGVPNLTSDRSMAILQAAIIEDAGSREQGLGISESVNII
jgi:hypothetical protein